MLVLNVGLLRIGCCKWLLLINGCNYATKFFESDMCADPYSDMILVDGITLLCNDIQVVFLNDG